MAGADAVLADCRAGHGCGARLAQSLHLSGMHGSGHHGVNDNDMQYGVVSRQVGSAGLEL